MSINIHYFKNKVVTMKNESSGSMLHSFLGTWAEVHLQEDKAILNSLLH